MSLPEPPSPAAWETSVNRYDWLKALRGVPQNPEYHGEGDALVHTQLVVEALLASAAWRALPQLEQRILHWAALLHDVAKPQCTRRTAEGVSSPGHSRRGEILARRILWELGAPFAEREHVAQLVRAHQLPFWALERERPERLCIELSQVLRCDLLAHLAEADVRGREARDRSQLLDHVELFRELCRDQGCYGGPFLFPSDHSRFVYFQGSGNDPHREVFDDTTFEVVLMSGLPAAGKDTWLRTNAAALPLVSLDALRSELGVDPANSQGEVVSAAKAAARNLLRERAPFAWNATNLSAKLRTPLVELFASYGARVRIVYCEAPREELRRRNRARPFPVPEEAIARMLTRWEVPTRLECHELDVVLSG